jgi:hypothetical protein
MRVTIKLKISTREAKTIFINRVNVNKQGNKLLILLF